VQPFHFSPGLLSPLRSALRSNRVNSHPRLGVQPPSIPSPPNPLFPRCLFTFSSFDSLFFDRSHHKTGFTNLKSSHLSLFTFDHITFFLIFSLIFPPSADQRFCSSRTISAFLKTSSPRFDLKMECPPLPHSNIFTAHPTTLSFHPYLKNHSLLSALF